MAQVFFALDNFRDKSDKHYVRFGSERWFSGRFMGRCAVGFVAVVSLAGFSTIGRSEASGEINQTLMSTAKSGNVVAAQRALEQGADPNCRVPGTWLNFTPLLQAISESHLGVAKLLLEHGADPYLEDDNGDPAMVFAVDKKNQEIGKLLLAHGVPIDAKNGEGLTALMREITDASPEDIQSALELGADPNQHGRGGETPLIKLAGVFSSSPEDAQRSAAVMKILIAHKANVNATNDLGSSALMYAAENGGRRAVETLVRAGADVNQQNKEGVTALMVALRRYNNEEIIDFLLAHGADVKVGDGKGTATLMIALEAGYLKAAARLISLGVDPKASTRKGRTAAQAAASFVGWGYEAGELAKNRRKAVELLRLISAAGGDLAGADEEGNTPLHCAVARGHLAAVEFLLTHGSDPNRPNAQGETPLMLSIQASMDAFVKMKLLLANGADINAKRADGMTVLMLAAQAMQRGALIYLLRQGADADLTDAHGATALSLLAANTKDRAVESRDFAAMIRALSEVASSIEQRDAKGLTPLMWTAISDLPEAVRPLLEKGADLHARSLDGRTALMWAASANAENTVRLLINSGSDPAAKDNQGRTAVEWARLLDLPVAKAMEAPVEAR